MSNEEKVKPTVQEYQGKKTLLLNPGGKFPFSFGVAKAKMILSNIEEIKEFVHVYDKQSE